MEIGTVFIHVWDWKHESGKTRLIWETGQDNEAMGNTKSGGPLQGHAPRKHPRNLQSQQAGYEN
jgi:hypothetical protein